MREDKNPYEVRVVSFRKKRKFIAVDKPLEVIDRETGEVTTATPLVGNSSYRDTSHFEKLYDPSVLLGLKLNEVKVLAYVLDSMDYSGMFILDVDRCVGWTGLHPNTIYIAMRRLCKLDIVRKDSKCKYWVNPNVACKGSRDGMNLVFDDETNSSL